MSSIYTILQFWPCYNSVWLTGLKAPTNYKHSSLPALSYLVTLEAFTRNFNSAIHIYMTDVVEIQPTGQALTKPSWVKIWISYRARTYVDCCFTFCLSDCCFTFCLSDCCFPCLFLFCLCISMFFFCVSVLPILLVCLSCFSCL